MYREISDWKAISFPVFKIPIGHVLQTEGLVTYSYKERYNSEAREIVPILRVLDDKSLPGDTLGRRRLLLRSKNIPLLRLPNTIYFLHDIIKFASGRTQFIDNNGTLFSYKKSRLVPLIFRKIVKRLPIPNSFGTIIEVEGIPTRFKTSLPIEAIGPVAGLLKIDGGYLLYGLYDKMYDNTRRKV